MPELPTGKRKSSESKRTRFDCRCCGEPTRTRKKHLVRAGICQSCLETSVKRSVPVVGRRMKSATLEWRIMPELWIHNLLYQNVEHNGLQALGLGHLWFIHERQRGRALGRYKDKELNEYDLLLRRKGDSKMVCVEVKRTADEGTIAQVLRYEAALERAGFDDPIMVIIAAEFPHKVLDVIEKMRSYGWEVRCFLLAVDGSEFKLAALPERGSKRHKERGGNDEDRQGQG